ncbi:DUF2256 domain-containing protein [Marivita sp. S2033]|uniref:DUF2256 domain-containing protein n=1 Tax=Marivita sp. S2033 TaxID=3373187 RepID=UPI0039829447
MPRTRKKSDLPSKICPTCARPFTWRKKWEKSWNDVRYCSQRCRTTRGQPASCDRELAAFSNNAEQRFGHKDRPSILRPGRGNPNGTP